MGTDILSVPQFPSALERDETDKRFKVMWNFTQFNMGFKMMTAPTLMNDE
jgi:hypothetical protein